MNINCIVNPEQDYSEYSAALHLASGLTTGLAGLAGGWAIGVVGDAAVRNFAFQQRIFVGMVLVLIFAEVLGTFRVLLTDLKCQDFMVSLYH